MRRVVVAMLLVAPLVLAAVPAQAQTATPYPGLIPLPNGCWPVGGFYLYSAEPVGGARLEYDDNSPCDEALAIATVALDHVTLRFMLTQYVASSDLRVRMGILAGASWVDIRTYKPDGTTNIGWVRLWVDSLPEHPGGYGSQWKLLDTVISADTDYGGFVEFEIRSVFISSVTMAAMHIADNELAFPAGDCALVLPTRTPTPTIIPTPTGTITQTWTPGPTWAAPTLTPTSTPPPYATWTPSPSPTPWQTPMSTLAAWQLTPDASVTPYATPAAADALPTWAPWPTVAWPTVPTVAPSPTRIVAAAGITPTLVGTPGAVATAIMTAASGITGLMGWVDDFESEVDFQRVYSDAYDMTGRITLPIGLFRGLEPYMPHTYPMISFLLTALLLIALTYAITLAAGAFGLISGALQWIADLIDGVLP